VIDKRMNWGQVIEAWYQKAIMVARWDARKYPRTAESYVMKNTNGDVIEHMDGMDIVFAYYIPSMTVATPPQPPKRKEIVPQPTAAKPITLKAIEMTTGDVITFPNIARYEEAISTAGWYSR
jgi:hypothetical protein